MRWDFLEPDPAYVQQAEYPQAAMTFPQQPPGLGWYDDLGPAYPHVDPAVVRAIGALLPSLALNPAPVPGGVQPGAYRRGQAAYVNNPFAALMQSVQGR